MPFTLIIKAEVVSNAIFVHIFGASMYRPIHIVLS